MVTLFASYQRYQTPIRIVLATPQDAPAIIHIPPTLAALQNTVKGFFEVVWSNHAMALLANEEAQLLHMPYNRTFHHRGHRVQLYGPLVVVAIRGDDFTSLTVREAEAWAELLS